MVDYNINSEDHKSTAFKAKSFVNICRQKESSDLEFGSNAYRDKVKKKREILTSIIGAVVVCGRQNIALRGKTEDRSNFKAILKYRAEKDDLLKEHLTSAPNHAKYMTPRIQNAFINLCGTQSQTHRTLSVCSVFYCCGRRIWLMLVTLRSLLFASDSR